MKPVERGSSRARLAVAWLLSAAVVVVYLLLPNTDDDAASDTAALGADSGEEPRKLEVVRVRPEGPAPGTAIAITYSGAPRGQDVIAFAGKEPLEVLAQRPGSLVAKLPAGAALGHLKIRVSSGGERSKPYDVTVKQRDYRKPFRALAGGIALLLVGTAVLARGARAFIGLDTASQLARFVTRRPAAIGFGAIVGTLTQSTTSAAGVLSALTSGGVLAVSPAAMAFFGAGLAASIAPFVLTGIIEPKDGPLAIAVGVIWYALAPDRRASAVGRLVLGAGFLSLGLHLLRPGFEPFLSDPALLSAFRHLRASSVPGVVRCALLGAVLVGVFQGPAPVVVLVLALAEATGLWDLQTSLAVLAGTSVGAATAALLTMQGGQRSRHLAVVNLAAGLVGTVFSAASVHLWAAVSDFVVRGSAHEVQWGKRVLLPNLGWHLVLAFALSQLTATVLVAALVPSLERRLARLRPLSRLGARRSAEDAVGAVQSAVLYVLSLESAALVPISELSLGGVRRAGRRAEHHLSRARDVLEEALSETVPLLPASGAGPSLGRVAFSCLQLHRSVEAVLRVAERLTDVRIGTRAEGAESRPLDVEDEDLVKRMQTLLGEALTDAAASLEAGTGADLDAFRDREIRMNAIEAKARATLVEPRGDAPAYPMDLRARLGVLELIDACEVAGNQVYRLAQALGDADALDRPPPVGERDEKGGEEEKRW